MAREPVLIERGGPNASRGLPRPLARNKGTLRPVPWTNEDGGWGLIHEPRAEMCEQRSLCLVCGEVVEEGFIFTDKRAAPTCADQYDLADWAADHGPLHPRCAKMTVAHCRHIRNELLQGETFLVRYCRQLTLIPSDPTETILP